MESSWPPSHVRQAELTTGLLSHADSGQALTQAAGGSGEEACGI